jgi:hypothetical protein
VLEVDRLLRGLSNDELRMHFHLTSLRVVLDGAEWRGYWSTNYQAIELMERIEEELTRRGEEIFE